VPEKIQGISVYPLKTERKTNRFDLAEAVWTALEKNRLALLNQDIIAVSSKFASVSEGRVIELSKVTPTAEAVSLAGKFQTDPSLAELVLQESEFVLGGIQGFILSIVHGTLAPNAGIDRSNVAEGWAILYPENPSATAAALRKKLIQFQKKKKEASRIRELGIVLTDSRVTPTRLGTVGVALAVAGIRSTIDMRGSTDLYGNKLKVTLRAIADQAASAAQLVMGEAGESIPIAIIRGLKTAFSRPKSQLENSMTISADKCLILRGLDNRST
jgi:coenzyme F420-0:L-glutamate ligase/coenzyme F420-1:gamma-L-glutamate ligase